MQGVVSTFSGMPEIASWKQNLCASTMRRPERPTTITLLNVAVSEVSKFGYHKKTSQSIHISDLQYHDDITHTTFNLLPCFVLYLLYLRGVAVTIQLSFNYFFTWYLCCASIQSQEIIWIVNIFSSGN